MRRGALERPGAALALVAAALLSTAGAIGLLEPTETRYAEVAREMRADGDWLVPRLNGIPHFHKPPLAYWATALGFAAAGENAWGARLPATLAAILTLAFAVRAARRLATLAVPAGLAVWILGTAPLFFLVGRSVAADPYLAASVAGFWALAPSPWALAALGLGFLAKGPVALALTALPALAASAWGRDRAGLRLLGPAWGWVIFAAVALPWYLAVAARTPGLLGYFLGNQLWERYATEAHQRGGPPGYFVGVLLAGALPWTPALLAGLARVWRGRAVPEARLLLAWLAAPLVFFSFSGSKLPAYLLPVFPAVALIAARGLAPAGAAVRWATAGILAGVAAAAWIFGPAAFGRLVGLDPPGSAALPLPAHVGLACLLYAATWMARGQPARCALLALLGWTALGVALAPYEARLGSPRPLVRVLAENRAPGEPVVAFARFNAGLPFYLRETIGLVDVPRERRFAGAARGGAPVARDSLAALAAGGGRVWILGPRGPTEDLAASLGLDYVAVTTWRGSALGFVRRRPYTAAPDG